MSNNRFSPEKFHDFTIVDEDTSAIVGHIRIKPSGIHWCKAGQKKWRGVSLAEFSEFMEGKKKKSK